MIPREYIIIGSVAFIVIWMVVRWLRSRKKQTKQSAEPALDDVNRWYGSTREKIALMEREDIKKREEQWEALPREEKLELSDSFLRDRFGPRIDGKFSAEEKLTLGRTYYLTRV
jgi:hypothetical protein